MAKKDSPAAGDKNPVKKASTAPKAKKPARVKKTKAEKRQLYTKVVVLVMLAGLVGSTLLSSFAGL